MINELIQSLESKKIMILGFGVEGRSNYQFLRRYFPEKPLIVTYNENDFNEVEEFLERDKNLIFLVGKEYLDKVDEVDIILKSPGVSFKGMNTNNFLFKVTSQLELFLEYIDCYTIGVTGSKGKSTTSSLICQMLKEQGRETVLLGNIGIPIFDYIEEIKQEQIVVLEMSSHGLEYVKKSPNIAILLNVFEEHLDHYDSLNKYIEAKFNIFKYQKQEDIAIYNEDNILMKEYGYQYPKNSYAITMKLEKKVATHNILYIQNNKIYHNEQEIYDTTNTRKLKGEHMLNNIMFVLAVSQILKLNIAKTITSINSFKSLEHRMEYVGIYDGVEYYNDSIATIPESTINCVNALEKVDTLIVGGKDRGVDLTELIRFLNQSQIGTILCLPKTGEAIYKALNKEKRRVIFVQTLEEAVDNAKQYTKKGHICVLSPAASSYGYFKNFKDRGNQYKKLVEN